MFNSLGRIRRTHKGKQGNLVLLGQVAQHIISPGLWASIQWVWENLGKEKDVHWLHAWQCQNQMTVVLGERLMPFVATTRDNSGNCKQEETNERRDKKNEFVQKSLALSVMLAKIKYFTTVQM
jgi:hypothetical protein